MGFEFYAAITSVILYLIRRADTSFRSTSHYMTYGVRDGGDEAVDGEEDEREQSDLRLFVYASIHLETENDRPASFVYIASVSCCARINREMMRPAPGEMSSEPVMASLGVCAR